MIAEHQSKVINFNLNKTDFSIDFKRFEQKVRKNNVKVILINFPNNPTGKILNSEAMKRLVEIVDKYQIILISDEVYDRLVFSGKKFISFASYKKISNQTITINSFSKSFAMTGWRIGYMVANDSIIKKACKIQQHINTNVPEFLQYGALKALSIKPAHLKDYNSRLASNFNYLSKRFSETVDYSISESEGGLFAFVNISKDGRSSDIFCRDLIEKTNVACTPGIFFGKKWDKFIRVSLAINEKTFQQAIENTINFIVNSRKNS